jgi:peptide/nickel transport system permease protein
MMRYAFRRSLAFLPTLMGVALLTFVLFHVAGGDPLAQLVPKYTSPSEVEALRRAYGFDRSLPAQFLGFLSEIVTFRFGRSFETGQTVGRMLADGAWASVSLAFPAFLFAEAAAVLLGLLAALRRGRPLDRVIVVVCVLGMSVSVLAYILFGQYILAFRWGLFPISGYEPGWAGVRYLVLPWLIWIAVAVGGDARFYRTVFLEELGKDYVRTARAKGAGGLRVLFVHVLRNAAVPIVTRVVVVLPFLFTGSLLLENFFGIPGLGNLTVTAFANADWPVVKAVTLLGSLLFMAFNLISDLLCAALDPRVELR